MSAPKIIAVDWGTSNFRAYLADQHGRILTRVANAEGILAIGNRAFADVLRSTVGPWLREHGGLPVIMSGMIGSRQGWIEVPYVHCPASLDEIAAGLTSFHVDDIGAVHLVPGLDHAPEGEPPDVMRGEEAQIVGAMTGLESQGVLFVHPGTHSKWVSVADGVIERFSTYMTGEVYAALKDHTILGRLMEGQATGDEGFLQGVETARHSGTAGTLLHRLFSARTLGLHDRLPPVELSAYLSGLLIGAEIAAAAPPGMEFTILGSEALASRYAKAAEALGRSWRRGPADSVVPGLLAIARAAGLIGGAP